VSEQPLLGEIAGFRLIRLIGEGGFGDVYEAERNGQRLALKLFRGELADSVDRKRFLREITVLRELEYLHLVRYVDSGEAQLGPSTRRWLAMELLEGQTLHQELQAAAGQLAPARASEIARQVALGLAALHERGIVHRDLKPRNIHIGADGIVRLLDFGVVSMLDTTTITVAGRVPGTLAYAAPEQLRNQALVSIDLYALGVVIYEMLTGRRPHHGDAASLYGAILYEEPEPPRAFNPAVPRELEQLVMSLLEKEPMDRPASALAVVEALRPKITVAEPTPQVRRYSREVEPRIYVRVGTADVGAFTQACLRGYEASGIVVGVTEGTAIAPARRATAHSEMEFLVDPLVPRLGFLGHARTKSLRQLDYSPPGLEPYQAPDFKAHETAKQFVRKVLLDQDERGADRLFAPALPIRSDDDKTIALNAKLIDYAVTERSTFANKPIAAQVPVSLELICTTDARTELANRLRRGEPDEYWLLLSPLTSQSDVGALSAALRFALLLQETGARSVLARAGDLRRLFLAFGVGGAEVGLGRLVGFRFSDWEHTGGPGYIPPRFEFPSLLCALPRDLARAVLASGLLPESDCPCRSCQEAGSLEVRLEASSEHNAHVVHEERLAYAGAAPAARVRRLQELIENAAAWGRQLRREEDLRGLNLKHLAIWSELIELDGAELLAETRMRRRSDRPATGFE
jgi:serine/threonine protein kinase